MTWLVACIAVRQDTNVKSGENDKTWVFFGCREARFFVMYDIALPDHIPTVSSVCPSIEARVGIQADGNLRKFVQKYGSSCG